jgi:hypothetical protein
VCVTFRVGRGIGYVYVGLAGICCGGDVGIGGGVGGGIACAGLCCVCWRGDVFSSFIVLLCSSIVSVFGVRLAGVGAGVMCGGYGSCDHSESVSSDLLLVAKSCLCW